MSYYNMVESRILSSMAVHKFVLLLISALFIN